MAEGDEAEEEGDAAETPAVIDDDTADAMATATIPLRILRLLCIIINNMFIQFDMMRYYV
jgi:hypothetical protein